MSPLAHVLRAPTEPGENLGNWDAVEAEIGTQLPDDYKDFIREYGSGIVNGQLMILNPFAKSSRFNLLLRAKAILDANRGFVIYSGKSFPFPSFPEPEGLLPWGVTTNGDVLYWQTRGPASTWNTVIVESRVAEVETFASGMGPTLLNLITGKMSSHILGDDFLEGGPAFESRASPET